MKARFLIVLAIAATACSPKPKWESHEADGYNLITQKGGPDLGYTSAPIIEDNGFAFKDLNRNGTLEPYEDWRLDALTRAQDLAGRLTTEEIAGLMLYSSHQAIPGPDFGKEDPNYSGPEIMPWDITDQQRKFLYKNNLRAVLVTSVQSPEVAARWNNNVQAFVEKIGSGIPVNISSDPRNETAATAEFNLGSGGQISLWPTPLGLAATFDPELVREFGSIASREYRALGIATALSPQIDLATEPRWSRFNGTFGEDPDLDTDMARAYVDGFQTSPGGGWGTESVNAMVKHWPSGGPEEGGRDAHFNYGKYAVYPGGGFKKHLQAFTQGAFKLTGGTGKASAVMPYYTISYGIDPSGKNVGNSYSDYIIGLLRSDYSYDGVVCTDWNITYDNAAIESFDGKCWGVEKLSVARRHYKAIMAGVDQFGGNNDMGPVIQAYDMLAREFGEGCARQRFEGSAVRLLLNSFRTGLFENPYTDPAAATALVGNPEFMKAGYEAQLKSVVMVKNHGGVLPMIPDQVGNDGAAVGNDGAVVGNDGAVVGNDGAKSVMAGSTGHLKVWVPKRYYPQTPGMFGLSMGPEAHWDYPVDSSLVAKYFEWAASPDEADFALVFIKEPHPGTGYDVADRARGGNGYVPISLQYRPYTAEFAREKSIAGGDPKENFTNRSYKGKTVKTPNEPDLDLVLQTRQQMGAKPLVVVVSCSRPAVLSELEPYADAVLLTFGVQNQAVLDIVSGAFEPSGLLPMQMPADMRTVEEQCEDLPHDMRPLVDADGGTWDFGWGLNWNGQITDERTAKYVK